MESYLSNHEDDIGEINLDQAVTFVDIEVRDSPHGIFGSCTRYPRGLARWAELLGRRRRRRPRRRRLVSLFSKGTGHQNVRSQTRMLGPSVFPDSNTEEMARGQVFRMLGSIPECLVLQYFKIQILKD